MPSVEYYGDQDYALEEEELQKITTERHESVETTDSPLTLSSTESYPEDPGLGVLVGTPNQHLRLHRLRSSTNRHTRASSVTTMAEQPDEPPPSEEASTGREATRIAPELVDQDPKSSVDSAVDLSTDALEGDENPINEATNIKQLVTRTRTDSMQVDAAIPPQDVPFTRSELGSPLRIRTSESNAAVPHGLEERDSISASPTLSKHVIQPTADANGQSLPPLQPPSPTSNSPKAERLPSIHQITSSLTELAEAATQELPRHQQGIAHHHSQSFGSATSQSPNFATHPYPASIQTSPQAYYAPPIMARSPTSTLGESKYASPPAYPLYGPYSHRRASMADGVPPLMPNLPTASSSGDSYGGYPSSGTEGYSTSHTTPVDIGQVSEGTPRPMLPPPPGMPTLVPPQQPLPAPILVPGPYKCDVPNCTAGTFQTQYLLNSHKNVHSQSRPHYCPVAGCSRSEGGKGFKRKNEMIRHGLVHKSPGYICPYCPEREHRYPRPDNLQRHVRVHHVDKDRDDIVLRDVLNQRTEGQGKTRRRRTNTGPLLVAL